MISRRNNNLMNRLIALIPLTILIVERVGWTINNHSVTDFALRSPASVLEVERLSIPGDFHVPTRSDDGTLHKSAGEEANGTVRSTFRISVSQRVHQQRPIPLDNLLQDDHWEEAECGEGLLLMQCKHMPYEELFSGNRKIPRIVHQTSRSSCLTEAVAQIAVHWSSLGHDWAYYFHSDSAVDRLFAQDWPEFPHLSAVLACLNGKGTLKADLWRYLVLWEYGGVYADVDTKPNKFNGTTITAEDDGFFIVEQYHLLSQYFMAMSPRHRKSESKRFHPTLFNTLSCLPHTQRFSDSPYVLHHPTCPFLTAPDSRYGNDPGPSSDWSACPAPRISGLPIGCWSARPQCRSGRKACQGGGVGGNRPTQHYGLRCW